MIRLKKLRNTIRNLLVFAVIILLIEMYIDKKENEKVIQKPVVPAWIRNNKAPQGGRKYKAGFDSVLAEQDVTDNPISLSTVSKRNVRKQFKKIREGLKRFRNKFYLNDRPFQILGGTFHYFRVHPAAWHDRLIKVKSAGLNTVVIPVPWNIHEATRGTIKFTNIKWDLLKVLNMTKELGLYTILQVGPFINAGLDWGGLPSWLLHENIKLQVRSSNEYFINPVRNYFEHLIETLVPFCYTTHAGPIIGFQIEDGFGQYYQEDKMYINFLAVQFHNYHINEMLFLSDSVDVFERDMIPNVHKSVLLKNPDEDVTQAILAARGILKDSEYPILIMNFPTAPKQWWCYKQDEAKPDKFRKRLERALLLEVSIVLHPFIGGTNFGFMGGTLNSTSEGKRVLKHELTSYFPDAPILEGGVYDEKYFIIRSLLKEMKLTAPNLPPPPLPNPPRKYGDVKINDFAGYDQLLDITDSQSMQYRDVRPMETLDMHNGGGQSFGYVIYRTEFIRGQEMWFIGAVHDYGLILINNQTFTKIQSNVTYKEEHIDFSKVKLIKENNLDIFLENAGRVYGDTRLNDQRKGLRGRILINFVQLLNFKHVPIEFSDKFCKSLNTTLQWETTNKTSFELKSPTFFRVFLEISGTPHYTFIDLTKWGKGLVIVNGYLIGRYWNKEPQRKLYIPSELLKTGSNVIIIFELSKAYETVIFSEKLDTKFYRF
ncbi:unnamed protein product [Dimorphilus gyrociliatus]|uniref:Uncharacterized protein n=1 Tax=Dimorphilus gyrociliatus TaxID=2664684 RepID=A0A7I8WBG7_9ANNE|nr:unnamed protein product [Dimorphilus gyrociliatus]